MCEEDYDSKYPLHTDEEFQRGIQFKIKVIELFFEFIFNSSLVHRFTRSTKTIESM